MPSKSGTLKHTINSLFNVVHIILEKSFESLPPTGVKASQKIENTLRGGIRESSCAPLDESLQRCTAAYASVLKNHLDQRILKVS